MNLLLPGDPFLKFAEPGTEVHAPIIANPYQQDPDLAKQYENGYHHAQELGHLTLSQSDPAQWASAHTVWREGFAKAATQLGQKALADALSPQVDVSTRNNESRLAGLL